jgi:flotillin
VNGMFKSIPPLSDFMDQAGLSLPEYLAKKQEPNHDKDEDLSADDLKSA